MKYLKRIDPFVVIVLVAASVYVFNAWTPSSYGTVLKSFGADGAGLVLGEPRDVRSDESRVWTPYIQITVNNGFKRFNETSVYREDLRNFNGLPLADWAIVLKPYFWPFFFAQSWYAFSFYHAFFIVLFLIGYYFLLQRFGFASFSAGAATVALFFTSFIQFWWTTWGPILAGFPWVLLMLTATIRPFLKVSLLGYITGAWLLAHFYPPLIISLIFVSLLTILAFKSWTLNWHSLLLINAGIGGGFVIVGLYLKDAIPVMTGTVYPGQRVLGGGGLPPTQWLAQFFPFFVTSGFKNLVNINVCEAATVGSYLPLLSVVFTDHRQLAVRLFNATEKNGARQRICLLLLGFLLTSLWQLLPVPSEIGKIFFWHKVPPRTMLFASGVFLFLLSLDLLRVGELRITWPRFAWTGIIVLVVWMISKRWLSGGNITDNFVDVLLLLPLGLVVLFRRFLRLSDCPGALIGCVAVTNLLGFGAFNPIQQARPIFDRPRTPTIDYLKELETSHPEKWLVVAPSYGGAVLNGWGFRSIEHALIAPQLRFFRPFFPEMSDEEFNRLFNRYGHISLFHINQPKLAGVDIIYLPVEKFSPVAPKVVLRRGQSGRFPVDGYIDAIVADYTPTLQVSVIGWAFFDARNPLARLYVYTDLPIDTVQSSPQFRPDVMKAVGDHESIIRGFQIQLTLKQPVDLDVVRQSLCVVSEDADAGAFLLNNPAAPSACSKLTKAKT